jgi:hypothetical protein
MLTANEIHDIVLSRGDSLFPLGMSQYLSNTNKPIWGLLIDPNERRFQGLFGDIPPEDLEQFNTSFHHTKAGYRVKARDHFPKLTSDADVFLISKECLALDPKDVEALIIHELCHWYIDSGLQSSNPIGIGSTDRLKAKNWYRKTDQENEHMTRHTLPFCELLCAVAARAVHTFKGFPNREALLASAMQFDIKGGFPV